MKNAMGFTSWERSGGDEYENVVGVKSFHNVQHEAKKKEGKKAAESYLRNSSGQKAAQKFSIFFSHTIHNNHKTTALSQIKTWTPSAASNLNTNPSIDRPSILYFLTQHKKNKYERQKGKQKQQSFQVFSPNFCVSRSNAPRQLQEEILQL